MAADEPTLGEALRRLDAVTQEVRSVAGQLSDLHRDFAKNYVPRELYEARHNHLLERVTAIETENKSRDDAADQSRRQLQFMILGSLLAAGLSLIVALILASGGISS